jgi:hypothetical protein
MGLFCSQAKKFRRVRVADESDEEREPAEEGSSQEPMEGSDEVRTILLGVLAVTNTKLFPKAYPVLLSSTTDVKTVDFRPFCDSFEPSCLFSLVH